jgi:hypothetical protein
MLPCEGEQNQKHEPQEQAEDRGEKILSRHSMFPTGNSRRSSRNSFLLEKQGSLQEQTLSYIAAYDPLPFRWRGQVATRN